MANSFDYVVVGGGTAGVVIASRLKEYFPDARIVLLEAGANAVDHPSVNDVTDPLDWTTHFQEGLMVDYSTTPQEHLDNRKIPNLVGRLLSGSSGVNVGMWMRASTADLDVLAERAGNERFKGENLLRYYRRVETYFDATADKDRHGFDGPIHTVGGRKYPLRNALQESAESLGHKYNPTKGDPVGLGDITQCWLATSNTTATRQHSAKVYNLDGVEVFCDAPVARVLLDESKRAIAVELISGGQMMASKEIIISCGAHRTPQLLMLSGIGPLDQLATHGISQIIDSPAVGKNLNDHNVVTQYYKLKDPMKGLARPFNGTMKPEYGQGLPFDFTLFANLPAAEIETHLKEDGIDSDGFSEQNLLLRPYRSHYLSVAWYYPLLAHAAAFPTVKEDGAHISLSAFHMLPLSRGTVSLRSADPRDHPVCNPHYLSTKTDRFIFRRAIRENLRLVETEPLASEIEGEVPPENPRFPALTTKSSDEEIDARVRAFAVTIAHPMGTCALGTVLDDEFRVKGMKGLR
ncbi:hypothetical protein G6011_10291 [Alternaria panax]|uniref:Glucose-methanol-choline oxidoreductase N-terminal domain-containing protein n=1 Tax=Alternaria panax TaxID=48097 RepID=A0AAD4NPP8_9PLEO|nr:hypothetical protein G6011_10291 [Alternaria panax]